MKIKLNTVSRAKRAAIEVTLLAISMLVVHAHASATENAGALTTHRRTFGVDLSASRVIYHETAPGAILDISNSHDYPVLLESTVKNEQRTSSAPFLVTPPLLRLEGGQQSKLRIVRTGGDLPADRETMQWLCVKAIPPKEDAANTPVKSATLAVNIMVNECEKLIFRPQAVKGEPQDVADQLSWSIADGKLVVNNPTPFYMNLSSVSVGGEAISSPGFVAPYKTETLALPAGASGEVQWQIITDLGGDSRVFHAVAH
ncbi:MAG: fimbria/pilus periplasmic chaperone [Burkholderiaceae bacterium]|nr:fimbria/pilus periplasmic chaperone [Burkholderiaceae bacterium]